MSQSVVRRQCDTFDLDSNGAVDYFDLALFLSRFGSKQTEPDLDGDGEWGLAELAGLSACYGWESSLPPAPEGTPAPTPTPIITPDPGDGTPPPPFVTNGDWDLDFTAPLVAHPGWRVTQVNKPRLFRLAVVHEDDYERDVPLSYTIHRAPAHGEISGVAPNLIYSPDAEFAGDDYLEYSASDGTVSSNIARVYFRVMRDYIPPIGIPHPEIGIVESHTAYAGQRYDFDRDGVLEAGEEYRTGPNGPYTHYIDNSHPQATDANNPYGTISLPRRSIPSPVNDDGSSNVLPAGSVVEIHGGGYTGSGYIQVKGQGTASRPVFIRGGNIHEMPRFQHKVSVWNNGDSNGDGQANDFEARYMVFEYLSVPKLEVTGPAHHIAVRDIEVTGGGGTSTGGMSSAKTASHIVWLRLSNHNNGNWRHTSDNDDGYNFVSGNANNVWFLDGQATRAQSNGYHFNGQGPSTHHIYTGRCESWQNKQSAFGLKTAWHIIYSENVAHDSAPRAPANGHPSDWGSGFGLQYNPAYVYYLHNTIYNNSMGISIGSGLSSAIDAPQADQQFFAIRNNIFAIRRMNSWNDPANDSAMDAGSAYSHVAAFHMRGMAHRYIIGNTISNVVTGINSVGSRTLRVQSNILHQVTDPEGHHFYGFLMGETTSRLLEHNLFSQPNASARFGWEGATQLPLTTFRTQTQSCSSCFEADPLFTDALANDYTLQAASPAVDSGVLDAVYDEFEDRYGISIRMDDGLPDLGAFEF